MLQVVILAGGLATRLYPLTQTIPKCMLPCRGRPFVDYILAWMANHGVTDVLFCLGHQSEQVTDHLQKLHISGLNVEFICEPTRLGTGGAVQLACRDPRIQDDFLVAYGDSFMAVDFGAIAREARMRNCGSLMTVYRNDNRYDTSNCSFEPPLVKAYSKDKKIQEEMHFRHIDYGISYWQKAAFLRNAPMGREAWDLSESMGLLAEKGLLHGLEMTQRFYEIGSPQGYEEFQALLAGGEPTSLFSEIENSLKEFL